MPIELNAEEMNEAIASLKRYFAAEFDEDLGDLRAKLLIDYILKDIGSLAYNRGVADAERFFRRQVEELPAACFEPPFTYWPEQRKKK